MSAEIENLGSRNIEVGLSVLDLENFVFLDQNLVELLVGGRKGFDFSLITVETDEPGIYVGDIVGSSEGISKSLPIVFRILERGAPIFVDLTIPEDNRIIKPGDIITGNVEISNNLNEIINANVEYTIKDSLGIIEFSKSSFTSLKPGINYFMEEFETRLDMEDGNYLYYVTIFYDEEKYVDAASFRIESSVEVPGAFLNRYFIYGSIIFLFLIVIAVYYLFVTKKKKKTSTKKETAPLNKRLLLKNTLSKLIEIKSKSSKDYSPVYVDEYFDLIRKFFSKYYSLNSGFTFEEFLIHLESSKEKDKLVLTKLIKKIAYIPYSKSNINKIDFGKIIDETIKILSNSLHSVEVEFRLDKRSEKPKKISFNFRKKII